MGQEKPTAYGYVRMSTEAQLQGHSRQRQVETLAKWTEEKGFDLVLIEDLGISAFDGANIATGKLGRFLADVEQEKVPKGSYLLVESLDRISRQKPQKATLLFLRIITAGIKLVTVKDGREYSEAADELPGLLNPILVLYRSYEESFSKSFRGKKSWSEKRGNAVTKPMTAVCPAWMRISKDRTRFELRPERAAIVRSIFEDTAAGIGAYAITRRLNDQHISVWGKSNGWHESYIVKILKNRAVLGEFQPYSTIDDIRSAVGPPLRNYFPSVIDSDLFYRAQASRHTRRTGGGGRKGEYISNIFSGIVRCGYCNSSVIFENKGPPPRGRTFLVCHGAKRGLDCCKQRWRYDHFETSFLAFVEQLDLPNLVKNDDSEQKTLDYEIPALEGRLLSLQHDMDQLLGLLKINEKLNFVASKLDPLQEQTNEAKKQLEEKQAERQVLEVSDNAFYESKDQIKSLIAQLQTPGQSDLYKLRSQVSARIKSIVDSLTVAPAGLAPIIEKTMKKLESDKRAKPKLIERIKADQDKRFFMVRFKNGNTLSVYPSRDDPLRFDTRVVVSHPEGKTRLRTEIPIGSLLSKD